MKVNQFDLWIADLNPRNGTEPGKIRPVLVVQSNLLNKVHPSTLVCPVTTNVRPEATLLRVHLAAGSCGLHEACDVMIDQVRAIDNKRFVKRAGRIDAATAKLVKRNLSVVLDLA